MRHGTLLAIVLGLLGMVSPMAAGQVRGAAGAPGEVKAPPPPYVNVTRADGSVVKGHLTASDPVGVTVLPPAPPGKPANEPIVIKWTDVKRVSNGLTRAKVLKQWQSDQTLKAQLCPDCKGEGRVTCATCKGTAHDPAKLPKDCPTCKGELLVDCTAPKCDKGQVRCPKHCLSLADPGWFTKDGKKWRRFPEKGGYYDVSEAHVGQIVVADRDGRKSTVPCPVCGGKTTIDCTVCHGTGKIACPTCSKNDSAPKCPDCDGGMQICKTCAGTGMPKQ